VKSPNLLKEEEEDEDEEIKETETVFVEVNAVEEARVVETQEFEVVETEEIEVAVKLEEEDFVKGTPVEEQQDSVSSQKQQIDDVPYQSTDAGVTNGESTSNVTLNKVRELLEHPPVNNEKHRNDVQHMWSENMQGLNLELGAMYMHWHTSTPNVAPTSIQFIELPAKETNPNLNPYSSESEMRIRMSGLTTELVDKVIEALDMDNKDEVMELTEGLTADDFDLLFEMVSLRSSATSSTHTPMKSATPDARDDDESKDKQSFWVRPATSSILEPTLFNVPVIVPTPATSKADSFLTAFRSVFSTKDEEPTITVEAALAPSFQQELKDHVLRAQEVEEGAASEDIISAYTAICSEYSGEKTLTYLRVKYLLVQRCGQDLFDLNKHHVRAWLQSNNFAPSGFEHLQQHQSSFEDVPLEDTVLNRETETESQRDRGTETEGGDDVAARLSFSSNDFGLYGNQSTLFDVPVIVPTPFELEPQFDQLGLNSWVETDFAVIAQDDISDMVSQVADGSGHSAEFPLSSNLPDVLEAPDLPDTQNSNPDLYGEVEDTTTVSSPVLQRQRDRKRDRQTDRDGDRDGDESPISQAVVAVVELGNGLDDSFATPLPESAADVEPLSCEGHFAILREKHSMKIELNTMNRLVVNTKLIVAKLRGQEESYRVYIRNRDRILKKLLTRPKALSKNVVQKLVTILDETSIG